MSIIKKVLNSKHFPNQSEIAGGLAGIAAGLLSSYLKLDAETSAMLVGLVMAAVVRLVPDSVKDLAKRADTVIKENNGRITDLLITIGKDPASKTVVTKK